MYMRRDMESSSAPPTMVQVICCAAIVDVSEEGRISIAAAASSTWGRDATGNPFCSARGRAFSHNRDWGLMFLRIAMRLMRAADFSNDLKWYPTRKDRKPC